MLCLCGAGVHLFDRLEMCCALLFVVVKATDSVEQYGLEFSNDHIIEGKKCVSLAIDNTDKSQGISSGVIDAWNDNYLCVPWESKLEIVWVEKRPSTGRYDHFPPLSLADCSCADLIAAVVVVTRALALTVCLFMTLISRTTFCAIVWSVRSTVK